jgi:hypothetical protein
VKPVTDIDPLDNPCLDDALGGLRRGEDGRVYHPDRAIIIHEDGEFAEPVQNAKNRRARGQSTLWRRVGPLRYGDIEISHRTEVWHEEREHWWRAEEIDIFEDGEPVVTFQVKGSGPKQYFEVFGSQLAEMVEQGLLTSKQAVNERAEQMLEDIREKRAAES